MERLVAIVAAFSLVGTLGIRAHPRPAAAASGTTLVPTADAYVDSSNPTTNYGSRARLKSDANPVVRTFLRFSVSRTAGSAVEGTLKLYAESGNKAGFEVRQATDTSWIEGSITYRNAPDPGAVVGTSGVVSKGTWSSVNVSPAVDGDGQVTLVVVAQNRVETQYGSRESQHPPALTIDSGGSEPNPPPPPSPSPPPSPPPGPFPPPEGTPSDSMGWLVTCACSHSLTDDPIVAPGHPGGSHLHDFLANVSTNASSSYSTMTAGETTCTSTSGDTGGYWVPALYRSAIQVQPRGAPPSGTSTSSRQQFYYRNNLNGYPPSAVHTIPADLRIVAGKAMAQSEADNDYLGRELYWGCSDNSTGKLKVPPASCSTGIVSLHVGFPNCWNGVNVDSPDHKSHMSYPVRNADGKYVCPSTHPVPIPRMIMRLEYPVGTDTGTLTLASGAPYTIHGDFWNTWHQPRLDQLVGACINQGLDCGKI